ncbi:MAG TPA: STAS domain-containing protein [Desulfuromonadales bacterium]|nr:STAS domain-containing protein [Desulfuromonadales bacterium]
MKIYTKGAVEYIRGDLTRSGIELNVINSLSHSLDKVSPERGYGLRIDCGGVRTADKSGLQLLYVWMQCARLRGVESELVNMSATMQNTIHAMGLEHCFAGNS